MRRTPADLLALLVLLQACARGEFPVVPSPRPSVVLRPAEFWHAAAADDPAADSAWERAGREALAARRRQALPCSEAFWLDGMSRPAAAWEIELAPGQLLDVVLEAGGASPPPVLDILEVVPEVGYRPAASARGSATSFEFEAVRGGAHALVVRLPPGAAGSYRLTLRNPSGLLFPVAGAGGESIRGHFGDPRDGGRRGHDGVDIFAPRGTPVLSAGSGVVSRVETDRTGGRVVWTIDEGRNLTFFYAHLDRQRVRKGDRLAAGDTLGTVGNTGNARSSSPHLHFGVYRPGLVPVDPEPLLAGAAAEEVEIAPDSALAGLGGWARTRAQLVRLRLAPDRDAEVVSELAEGTLVRVIGAVQDWRRVQLPDGGGGFVANWLLEALAGSR